MKETETKEAMKKEGSANDKTGRKSMALYG
jgi:hypothetical protein